MFTAFNDKEKRRNSYVEAISYYLQNYKFSVIFVENSGEDISTHFEEYVSNGQLEVLVFNGNDYPAALGKGLGEMRCMEFAIKNSKLLQQGSFVFKITGRYKILNLGKYVEFYRKNPDIDLFADITNNFRLSASSFFGFRPFFAEKYLIPKTPMLNDSEDRYFEHILAKAILVSISEDIRFRILKYYPRISAISGTTGKAYKESLFYYIPRNIKYLLRYLIMIR